MKPVVIEKNVSGSGLPVTNVYVFCTRFKFTPYSTFLCSGDVPDDYEALVVAIPGVTRVAAYEHQGLYDLTVIKATAYDWEEIEPKVMEILTERHERLTEAEKTANSLVDALQTVDEERADAPLEHPSV